MANPTDKEISARAYKLWEEAGMPEGKEEEFWLRAEKELKEQDQAGPLGIPDHLT